MDQLLWHLLAGTKGGLNRLRILEALADRPYNAHQISEVLGLDYRTVRHHLDLMVENNLLARPTGDAYGAMYFVSGLLKSHWPTVERIRQRVRPVSGAIVAKDEIKNAESEGEGP